MLMSCDIVSSDVGQQLLAFFMFDSVCCDIVKAKDLFHFEQ